MRGFVKAGVALSGILGIEDVKGGEVTSLACCFERVLVGKALEFYWITLKSIEEILMTRGNHAVIALCDEH